LSHPLLSPRRRWRKRSFRSPGHSGFLRELDCKVNFGPGDAKLEETMDPRASKHELKALSFSPRDNDLTLAEEMNPRVHRVARELDLGAVILTPRGYELTLRWKMIPRIHRVARELERAAPGAALPREVKPRVHGSVDLRGAAEIKPLGRWIFRLLASNPRRQNSFLKLSMGRWMERWST
jgi:hypothetical protein